MQKWTKTGTTWTRVAILNVASGTLPGYRGIAGYAVGQTVTLLASTFETPNRLIRFIDDGTGTPVGTPVQTAATNTQFRGIAVSPHFAAP